jgi:hypothetical protein
MSFLNRYGTQFGAMPQSTGTVWFVSPSATYNIGGQSYPADNANAGNSPETAVRTIQQAITNATANVGDVIALLPGTHTSAVGAVNKAGLSFIGLPYFPESAISGYHTQGPQVTVTASATIALAITAADCAFYNIRFLPVTAQTNVTLTTAAARTRFVHCSFDNTGVAGNAATIGLAVTTANLPRGLHFQGCIFRDSSVTTSQGPAVNLAASRDFWFHRCTIYKDGQIASGIAWTTAITLEDLATGTFEEVNYVGTEVSVGTTKVITGTALTGAGLIHVIRCTSTVNTACLFLDDFAAADVDLCLNYVATVAGGTGGTLITATT